MWRLATRKKPGFGVEDGEMGTDVRPRKLVARIAVKVCCKPPYHRLMLITLI